MQYHTVIFDLDGTLLNTLDDLTHSVNTALSRYSFPLKSREEVRAYVGNGVERLMELSVPQGRENEHFLEALAVFREDYAKNYAQQTRPYPGVEMLLEKLSARGVKMAIVSNKPDGAVKNLNARFFGKYIPVAVGEKAGVRKKPAPDTVFAALHELSASPGGTVYVGDSEVDFKTAQNAGLDCIFVTWGFRSREELEKAGAKTMVNCAEEILKIVEG